MLMMLARAARQKHTGVELLCVLWVHRPADGRESLKGSPADADDARQNHSITGVAADGRGEVQLMLMMLARACLAKTIQSLGSNCYACSGFTSRQMSERV